MPIMYRLATIHNAADRAIGGLIKRQRKYVQSVNNKQETHTVDPVGQ